MVNVFTTKKCPNCVILKKWLKKHKIKFNEKNMEDPKIMTDLFMMDIYSLSTPVLQVDSNFFLPNEMFKENRLNEDLLLESFGVKK